MSAPAPAAPSRLDFARSFLEAQLPVSKIPKECYKERKSNHSRTLTGLGKWYGRKLLVLVRATLLGLFRPISDQLRRDRGIFLKLPSWVALHIVDGDPVVAVQVRVAQQRGWEAVDRRITAWGIEDETEKVDEASRLVSGPTRQDASSTG